MSFLSKCHKILPHLLTAQTHHICDNLHAHCAGSRHQSRSRPGSAAPSFYITDTEPPGPGSFALERFRKVSGLSSRESSMSPTPSMYGLVEAGHR